MRYLRKRNDNVNNTRRSAVYLSVFKVVDPNSLPAVHPYIYTHTKHNRYNIVQDLDRRFSGEWDDNGRYCVFSTIAYIGNDEYLTNSSCIEIDIIFV